MLSAYFSSFSFSFRFYSPRETFRNTESSYSMGWDPVQVLVEGGVCCCVCVFVCDGMGWDASYSGTYLTLANWDLSFAFVLGMGLENDDR